jgi:hypothetical protein
VQINLKHFKGDDIIKYDGEFSSSQDEKNATKLSSLDMGSEISSISYDTIKFIEIENNDTLVKLRDFLSNRTIEGGEGLLNIIKYYLDTGETRSMCQCGNPNCINSFIMAADDPDLEELFILGLLNARARFQQQPRRMSITELFETNVDGDDRVSHLNQLTRFLATTPIQRLIDTVTNGSYNFSDYVLEHMEKYIKQNHCADDDIEISLLQFSSLISPVLRSRLRNMFINHYIARHVITQGFECPDMILFSSLCHLEAYNEEINSKRVYIISQMIENNNIIRKSAPGILKTLPSNSDSMVRDILQYA